MPSICLSIPSRSGSFILSTLSIKIFVSTSFLNCRYQIDLHQWDFSSNTSVRLGRPHWLRCQSLRSIWSNGFRISSHQKSLPECLATSTVPLDLYYVPWSFAHSDCLSDLLGWLSSEILRLHVQGLMMMHCWRLIPQFDHTIWSLHLVAVV